jgi:hypothetical protein
MRLYFIAIRDSVSKCIHFAESFKRGSNFLSRRKIAQRLVAGSNSGRMDARFRFFAGPALAQNLFAHNLRLQCWLGFGERPHAL